jgi:hypothetical protein
MKKLSGAFFALALALGAMTGVAFAGGPLPSPEIDPGSMSSALTLVVGGLLLLKSRVRR